MIFQENIFTKTECEKIIGYADPNQDIEKFFKFSETTTAKFNSNKLKIGLKTSYNVFVILNDENTKWFFDKLTEWFEKTSGIKLRKENELQFCTLHKYEVGDRFTKHVDITEGFEYRRYNLGIQLNENYEGGEYVIWDDNENETIISKEIGTALAYHGRLFHEIKKITKGERWSIVMPLNSFNIIEKKSLL